MPNLSRIICALLTITGSFALATPLKAHAGTIQDIIITEDNTINGTNTPSVPLSGFSAGNPLDITIANNMTGSGLLNAYITGRDSRGAVVFLAPSGEWYYPDPEGSTTPLQILEDVALPISGYGTSTTFTLPGYITAARIWIAEGTLNFYAVSSDGTQLVEPSFANPSDPSAMVNWGFVEMTYTVDGIWANLSFVDFVSMILAMSLTLGSGEIQTRKGLKAGAVKGICESLIKQSAIDGQPWGELCVTDDTGTPLRILAPNNYIGTNRTAFRDYFDHHIDKVWSYYTKHNLTIDTQAGPGLVNCHVKGGYNLFCDGDNRSYRKPSATDIFGCNSGSFAMIDGDNSIHRAVVPRLCAAFNRGTLLQRGGNVQPSLSSKYYYRKSPNNHYSRIVHEYEVDGLGYAFSYDDVNPTGENQAGLVAGPDPRLLQIVIGGSS